MLRLRREIRVKPILLASEKRPTFAIEMTGAGQLHCSVFRWYGRELGATFGPTFSFWRCLELALAIIRCDPASASPVPGLNSLKGIPLLPEAAVRPVYQFHFFLRPHLESM